MTLSLYTTAGVPTNPTGWRATCLQVHNAILAVGLIQTTDTGQINFATVTPSESVNAKSGYAIYSFNDTYQASYPCFIRIDYGVDGAGASFFGIAIWMTVGTSTNGAGVIGSITSPTINVNIQLYSEANAVGAASGTSSRLTLVSRYNQTGSTGISALSVERIQSTAGADTTTGLVFTWIKFNASQNSFPYHGQQVLYFSGIQPAAFYNNSTSGGIPPIILPFNTTAWANGNFCFTSPVYPVGYTLHPPIQGLMVGFLADFPAPNYPLPVSIYGTSHQWAVFAQSWLYQTASVVNLLVRWD